MQLGIDPDKIRNSGIYRIRSLVNGKIYIGSAKDFLRRFWSHRNEIRGNRHHSPTLQRHSNKYGSTKLIFEILEEAPKENLIKLEQFYLDKEQPFGERGFNICKIAGSANKGKGTLSKKEREKKSRDNSGSKNPNFGKIASHEKRIRMSQTDLVARYSMDGKLIDTFLSPYEASVKTGFDKKCISQACNASIEKYRNFLWAYYEDVPPQEFPFKSHKERFLNKKKKSEDSPNKLNSFGRKGREVAQIASTGEFIELYDSLFYASKATNLLSERIRICCRNPHLNYGGYYWRYVQ